MAKNDLSIELQYLADDCEVEKADICIVDASVPGIDEMEYTLIITAEQGGQSDKINSVQRPIKWQNIKSAVIALEQEYLSKEGEKKSSEVPAGQSEEAPVDALSVSTETPPPLEAVDSEISKAKISGMSEIEVSDMSEMDVSSMSEMEVSGMSEMDVSGMSEMEVSDMSEMEVSGMSEMDVSRMSELSQAGQASVNDSLLSDQMMEVSLGLSAQKKDAASSTNAEDEQSRSMHDSDFSLEVVSAIETSKVEVLSFGSEIKVEADSHNSAYARFDEEIERFGELNQNLFDNQLQENENNLFAESIFHSSHDFHFEEKSELKEFFNSSDYVESETHIVLDKKVGYEVLSGDEFWHEANEIIVDHETIFYVQPEKKMVYSAKEPAEWIKSLKKGRISKLPIDADWQPSESLRAYPMQRFDWVRAIMYETDELYEQLSENVRYTLTVWPSFDLLFLDNTLLKLCTLLFVSSESLVSMMEKSGFGRSSIVGLMNACYTQGCLIEAHAKDSNPQAEVDMLDKFKKMFR